MYLGMMDLHIKLWRTGFKNFDVEEQPNGADRPQTVYTQENIDQIRVLIKLDRRLATRRLAEIRGLSHGTIGKIINVSLGLHKVCLQNGYLEC